MPPERHLVYVFVARPVCLAAAVCPSAVLPTHGILQYVGDQQGGVLEAIVEEHVGEAFVEFPDVGPKRIPRVPAAFQEVSLGNSTPFQSNHVLPDTVHM